VSKSLTKKHIHLHEENFDILQLLEQNQTQKNHGETNGKPPRPSGRKPPRMQDGEIEGMDDKIEPKKMSSRDLKKLEKQKKQQEKEELKMKKIASQLKKKNSKQENKAKNGDD